jgi:hypothetical protein
MPMHLQGLIQSELQDGEQIQWVAQPIPMRFVLKSLPIFLFAIPWTAFAVFWITMASGFKMPQFSSVVSLFPLFGVPFVLIGLGLLGSPLWMWIKARRTAYVLTNRRAIVLDARVLSFVVRSFNVERLQELRRHQHADMSGDLIFDRQYSQNSDGDRQYTDVGFLAIRDVRKVEDLIRSTATTIAQNNAQAANL